MASMVEQADGGIKTRLKGIWTAGDYDRFSRYLEGSARDRVRELVQPQSPLCLLRAPEFEMTCLDIVRLAMRP